MADDYVGVRAHVPADKFIDNETAANTSAPGGVASRQRVAVVAAGGAAVATETQVGGLTETAPGTDTASSGLNGRLQRIAQRLSSLLAVLPGSLGQKARSASLAVTLSSDDITALSTVNVGNFPGGAATETTLDDLRDRTSAQAGVWDYRAGANGTVSIPAGGKVLQITAIALGAAGSLTINGGQTIPIPYDGTDKVSTDLSIGPKGNLVAPTLLFSATSAYFVEFVV